MEQADMLIYVTAAAHIALCAAEANRRLQPSGSRSSSSGKKALTSVILASLSQVERTFLHCTECKDQFRGEERGLAAKGCGT